MIGHNGSAAALKSYVERLEKLAEEKAAISADMKGVFDEAKSAGFDPKAMRAILKERAEDFEDGEKRKVREALIDTYRAALGMLDGTPLGDAAVSSLPQYVKRGSV